MATQFHASDIATGSRGVTEPRARRWARGPRPTRRSRNRRLLAEPLEDRRVLAFSLPGLGEFPSDALFVEEADAGAWHALPESSAPRMGPLTAAQGDSEFGEIRGFKWHDVNGDGVWDGGEPPLADWTVYLDLNDNGQRDQDEPFAVTGADGAYAFLNLPPGEYVVREVGQFGYDQTFPGLNTGTFWAASYGANTDGKTQLAWIDADTGQVSRAAELMDEKMHGMVVTNDGRVFGINGLDSSLYEVDPITGSVSPVGPTGWVLHWGLAYDPATDTIYGSGRTSGSDTVSRLLVFDRTDGSVAAVGTGMTGPVGVSGLTFDPANQRILLFSNNANQFHAFDTQGNGTAISELNPGVNTWSLTYFGGDLAMSLTGSRNNEILFVNPDTGVHTGSLILSEAAAAEALEFVPGAAYGHRVVLGPGAVVSDRDFGSFAASGEIRGFKWHDVNGDGVWDGGEPPLAGWTVYLDLNDNGQWDDGEPKTVTGADGSYVFAGLSAGTYTVAEVMQEGWEQTSPGPSEPAGGSGQDEGDDAFARLAQDLAASLTTTASTVPMYGTDSFVTSDDATFQPQTAQSGPLINLNAFRADPRFADIAGQDYAIVVLDSGLNLTHPFFGDRIVHYQVFTDEGAGAPDGNGHGTNVTSIAASEDATYPGVASGVNIIHLKVLRDTNSGYFSWMEQALQWVVANAAAYNIAAVNMSIGDGGNYSTAHSRYGIGDELAALAALNILVSTSAGNGFYTANSVQGVGYPAADPSTLAVGAVFDADFGARTYSSGAHAYSTAPDRIAPFSQRHEVLSEIFAPGAPITGASNSSNGTKTFHGTSQASPHVAGATVLAQQIAEQHLGRRLTLAEFRELLRTTGLIVNDGDDEDDNVVNTGLDFPRLDMLALGEAILALQDHAVPGDGVWYVTVEDGEIVEDVNFGNRNSDDVNEITVTTFDDIIDPNDGLISLREAVLAANQSEQDVTILLTAGTYLLSIQGRNEDASLIGDLDILPGGSVTILGEGSAQTVIDANGLGDRVLDVLAGAIVNLEGLTITRGHMPNNGGGIRNAGTVQLHDVVVTDNSGFNGGGVRNTGQLTISASVISGNTASSSGGGISNFGGQLTLSGSTVSGNSAKFGGGLWTDATAVIVDTTFANNQVIENGGAISNAGTGSLHIERSTLTANRGEYGGGILNGSNATLGIVNSTFSGNEALIDGGAIQNWGPLTVQHSTFVGNRADANENGTGSGGGIRRGDGTISLHSTILAGNVRGAARISDDIAGTLESVSSFNLISDASSSGGLAHGVNGNIVGNSGSGTIHAAAILDPTLADHGGPTMTHALVADSPAIDAGDPDFNPDNFDPPLTTDQRGLARVADGLDTGIPRIDIGAYEQQQPFSHSQFVVTTFDDVVDSGDNLMSLREAVILANQLSTDATIILPAGIYTLTLQGVDEDTALTGDLDILSDGSVAIVGAGPAQTVIDASGLSDRVFHVLSGASLSIEGVTITGGTIPASGTERLGGAILNEGELWVTDSVLHGNAAPGTEAGYQGGGLANVASAVATVTGSAITGNQAGMGGGVLNRGILTLTDSQISGNTGVSLGGGIHQSGTDAWLSIESSSITGNAAASGGGIAAFGGQLHVVTSQLRDNVATDPTSGGGGGVYLAQTATGKISASTIAGNEALVGAGILLFGSLQVADSTISGNAAGLFAGGIGSGGTLQVLNSTVSANSSAQGGGGIAIDGGNAQILHSTLFGNRADSDGSGSGIGGGVLVNSGSMTLEHTIVAGNLRGSGEAVADDIASIVDTSSGYNLIGDADSAGGLTQGVGGNIVGVDWTTVLDPDLKNSGGPTLTHALIPGSPAIDAGNPDFDPAAFDPPLLTDQRGYPRAMSGLGTARVDIGAVEFTELIVVTTFDDVIDPDDGWISLREAIRLANQVSTDVTIHLPPGTYRLTIQGANEDEALTGDLDILPGGSVTIIDAGSGQTIIDASDLNDRVFHVLSGADLRIEGVTITGGAAPESGTNLQRSGGAILNSGTLAVTRSILDGNSAYRGAGLANSGGTAVVVDSAISNNTGVTFRPSGGGIYNSDGGTVSVTDSTIADNTAFTGVGILNDSGSTLTAVRISVTGNSATGSSAAIVNSGTLTVAASTISGNASSGISNDGTLVVRDTTIANNSALAMGQIGGGIRTRSAVTTIINSTISGNSAHGNGGGIYHMGGSLTLVNSTVVGNRANADGTGSFAAGGIYVSLGSMTLQNTIVAGNRQGAVSSDQPSDIMAYDSELAGTFSLIGDAATAGGLIHGQNGNIVGVDWTMVLDTNLADNGGPTLTHALIPDSPAIDAGDPSFDPDAFDPPLAYDQRGEGFPRVLEGRVDIGAFEIPSPQVETTTVVASSANPSIYGDAVFFTATVSAATETPTGTVQFLVGGTDLGGPVLLVDGVAQSPAVSDLTATTHTISAQYVPQLASSFISSNGQLAGGQLVNPRALTVSGITAADKVYDGTTEALLDVSGVVLVGRIGNDDVVLDASNAAGTFEDPNVGSEKTVFISGLGIIGDDAGNYLLIQPTTTASILAIGGTRIEMTMVREPSATDAKGERVALPASAEWVHEWQLFWVEIWVNTPDTTTLGVAGASVDLHYNTDYLTAIEIQYGPAFTANLTGTIDDALGLVSAMGGATEWTDVGDDAYVLLARVRFGSIGDDQVPVVAEACFIGPYDMGMALADGQTELVGAGAAVPELGGAPETELWAVMYDFDDNNLIDFGDFSYFAPAFGKFVGPPQPPYTCWADFDKSGQVDFGDLSFFAPNFAASRDQVQSGAKTLAFPPNFPDAWRAAPAAPGGEGEAMGGDAMHQPSSAEAGTLAGFASEEHHAIVRQEQPVTGLAARVPATRIPAATDAMFAKFGIAEQERTPPWLRPRSTTADRESHLIETFRQPESPVTPNPRSDSSVAMSVERVQRWSHGWEPLEDLLSLLADQPSDRLLDPHEALFTQAGQHVVG